jgi:ribosomal protein S18 acetylase RimI-like enzyme
MAEQWTGEDVDIQQYIDESIGDDLNNLERVYLSRTSSPCGAFWVATRPNESEILGMVGLQYLNDSECELRRMSVSPKARRMGVGSRLLKNLLSFAKDQGYAKVLLSTGTIMYAGRQLYEKHGFTKTKEELVAPNVLITFYEYIL